MSSLYPDLDQNMESQNFTYAPESSGEFNQAWKVGFRATE